MASRFLLRTLLLVFLSLAAAVALCSQGPRIDSVVSSADFKPGIATRSLATIFGAALANVEESAGSLPLPKKLAGSQVIMCQRIIPFDSSPKPYLPPRSDCLPVDLLFVSPTQINFFVSVRANYGNENYELYIDRNGVPSSPFTGQGAFKTVWVVPFQPRVFEIGYDCVYTSLPNDTSPCDLSAARPGERRSLRGALTDQNGAIVLSSNPARVGGWYTVWLTGIASLADDRYRRIPYATRLKLSGDQRYFNGHQSGVAFITPSYAGPSAEFHGLDQINFRIPEDMLGRPAFADAAGLYPCGNYQFDLALVLYSNSAELQMPNSNFVNLPLLIKNGDVPCR
jgi:uncharacterized protein (TIGR03437 family)